MRLVQKELVNLVEKGTLRLMLGHLSEENNTVPLAMSTSVDLLTSNGMKYKSDYSLDVAPSVSTTKSHHLLTLNKQEEYD